MNENQAHVLPLGERRRTALRLAVVAVLALLATLVVPSVPAAAAERTVTYTVVSQGTVRSDLGHVASVAAATLNDPRGWSLGGTLAFKRVSSGSNFTLILASPSRVAAASPGCDAYYSCRVGRNVYINDDRWRTATSSWPHGLATYRQYVILHEVGHWLGMGHRSCPGSGRLAPVMQQQSISLQGCRANVWPVIAERAAVGSRWGVSVNWSGVERRYRALGQEGGILRHAVSWEKPTPDRVGRYQHYAGRSGASIYWTPATGAREVYGAIRDRWAATGWERGPLGYPTSGEYDVPGGRRSDFQHGSITWDRATGRTTVVIR